MSADNFQGWDNDRTDIRRNERQALTKKSSTEVDAQLEFVFILFDGQHEHYQFVDLSVFQGFVPLKSRSSRYVSYSKSKSVGLVTAII